MNHPPEFRPSFRLGDWTVHPGLNRIAGAENEIQVEPRVMQVLLRLAEAPGDVVSRNSLLEDVWGDAIVGEENLTRAISELRRIFGDSARRPRYIETIRHHGYRLIIAVEEAGDERPGGREDATETVPEVGPDVDAEVEPRLTAASADTPAGASNEAVRARSGRPRTALLVVAVALIAAVGAVFGPRLLDRTPEGGEDGGAGSTTAANPPTALHAVPLTSLQGREWHPALSPDGTLTAFIWAGPDGDNADVYLKQRNSERLLRLTDEAGWAAWPTWSPDGRTVAFVQHKESRSCVCTVPSLGGVVRTLLEVDSWIEGLDWSPDGGFLAFSATVPGAGGHRLQRLDLEDLQAREIPVARPDRSDDFLPRLSPDGASLAWIGTSLDGGSGVFVAPAAGGEARRIVAAMTDLQGLAWSADGAALIFAQAHGGIFGLRRLELSTADESGAGQAVAALLSPPGDFAWNPAVARSTGELAYEQVRVDQDIWRLQILGQDPWRLETNPFLRSTRWESAATFAPDGSRVAFVSSRSGTPELWTCDPAGENLQRLTQMGFGSLGSPRWSTDGRYVAANAVHEGRASIVIVAARGGAPRILASEAVEVFSDWTGNGRLLVGSDRGDGWQIYEKDPDTGESTRRTHVGGIAARESRTDGALYYLQPGRPGLWCDAGDGEPQLVVPDLEFRDRRNWDLLDGGVAWVQRNAGRAFLVLQDLESGWTSILVELPDLAEAGLGISPDGKTVFFTRTRAGEGDLMLLQAAAGSF